MAVSLRDRRCIVTGGTTGMGREIVRLLTGEGAHVVTMGREAQPLEETLALAGEGPGSAEGITGDVTDRESLDSLFALADDRHGGLDILVVAAALGAGPLAEMAEDEWRYVVDTNLTACLAACHRAIPRMRAAGGGHIVIIGSVSVALKAVGESVYAATKGGLQAFNDTLRKELAPEGIRLTLIEPGATATDMQERSDEEKRRMVEEGEMLDAVEVAEGAIFALTRSPRCDVVRLRMEPVMPGVRLIRPTRRRTPIVG